VGRGGGGRGHPYSTIASRSTLISECLLSAEASSFQNSAIFPQRMLLPQLPLLSTRGSLIPQLHFLSAQDTLILRWCLLSTSFHNTLQVISGMYMVSGFELAGVPEITFANPLNKQWTTMKIRLLLKATVRYWYLLVNSHLKVLFR
jgi:hypothetical protein